MGLSWVYGSESRGQTRGGGQTVTEAPVTYRASREVSQFTYALPPKNNCQLLSLNTQYPAIRPDTLVTCLTN